MPQLLDKWAILRPEGPVIWKGMSQGISSGPKVWIKIPFCNAFCFVDKEIKKVLRCRSARAGGKVRAVFKTSNAFCSVAVQVSSWVPPVCWYTEALLFLQTLVFRGSNAQAQVRILEPVS